MKHFLELLIKELLQSGENLDFVLKAMDHSCFNKAEILNHQCELLITCVKFDNQVVLISLLKKCVSSIILESIMEKYASSDNKSANWIKEFKEKNKLLESWEPLLDQWTYGQIRDTIESETKEKLIELVEKIVQEWIVEFCKTTGFTMKLKSLEKVEAID